MGRWFGEGYWRVAADAKTMKRISFASWVSLSTIIPNRASQKKEVEKEPFFFASKITCKKRMYPRKIRILMHQNTLRRNAWYLLYVWPILSVLLQYRIFFAKFHSICLCSKSAYTFELECKQPSFAVLKTLNMLSCKNFHGWKNHLRVLHMLELLTILLFGKLPYLLSFWSRRRQQFNSIERGHRHCLEIDLKMRTTSISWQSLPNRRGILWKKIKSAKKNPCTIINEAP